MINSSKINSMDDEVRLKRLRYRSWHRGCKETDLVLGQFAEGRLKELDKSQLAVYERLLDENDADIWDWLTGKTAPQEYTELLEILRASCSVPSAS